MGWRCVFRLFGFAMFGFAVFGFTMAGFRRFVCLVRFATRLFVRHVTRPLPHLLDRRSAEIRYRVGDVLVDRRNVVFAEPGFAFLAAIAPAAAPAAAASPAGVAVAVTVRLVGPRSAGCFSALVGAVSLDVAFGVLARVLAGIDVG
jgi:hypothetical protein